MLGCLVGSKLIQLQWLLEMSI